MDYKVLYRKYRPNDFTSIIGQEYIVSILKNSIKKGQISHAYIFSGPRGTGKTSTAKVFAKAINCLNPTESGPCGNCEACIHFKENADIIEIDAASNNGVNEIREIINNIKLAPAYSKYKVYIIDEVHMLSDSAFNALLLTLEEPPKHVVFILATTNIEDVPITILSRTQRFDFHKINNDDIIKRLEYVIKEEKINIEPEALQEIAYISDGGLRDALSILDQLSGGDSKITLNEVLSHFGSVSIKQIKDLYNTIVNNDVDKYETMMKNFKSLAIDYKVLIRKLLEQIESEALKSKKDKDYQGLSYNSLKEMAYEIASISNYVNLNVDPYLLIEISLLKYFNNQNSPDPAQTSKGELNIPNPQEEYREKQIEKPLKRNESPLNMEIEQINNLVKVRLNNCFVSAKKDYLQNIKSLWPTFLSSIDDKFLLNLLIDSEIAVASEEIVVLTHSQESSVTLLNENLNALSEALKKCLKMNCKFVALSTESWQKERQQYITNLKNKIEYKYIEEPKTEKEIENVKSSIEEAAASIFDKEIIEIE